MGKVRKRRKPTKIGENEYIKLSDLDTCKNDIIIELRKVEYNYREDMVFRIELTYSEIEKILDVKSNPTSCTGYTLQPGIYEISDNNLILKPLLPDVVKVNITIDDIRLRWILPTNKTIRFTKKLFPLLY